MKKYFVFTGRAGRTEYWSIWISNLMVALVYGVFVDLSKFLFGYSLSNFLAVLIGIPVLVAMIFLLATVTVRRLHDFDFSGWYAWFLFVPVIGGIVWIVIGVRPPIEGRYGPDPCQFRHACNA